jgi:translation initiation factor 6
LPITRISLYGNPNIGAFTFATDKFALIPPDMPPGTAENFSSMLGVPAFRATIGGSVLLGIFLTGNSRGVIVPNIANEEEISFIEHEVKVPVVQYNGKKNALGNMILVNDRVAMVGSGMDPILKDLIAGHLEVKVHEGSIATLSMPGVCAVINNRGLVAHPLTSEEEMARLGELFNIHIDVSTINCGFPYLRVGMTANSNGAVVGEETTGPEMARIESSLGFME